MRQEEGKKTPPLLPLRVSECPGVCWVPTPCGPVATHAESPGMRGMSPAHGGELSDTRPEAGTPLLRNLI